MLAFPLLSAAFALAAAALFAAPPVAASALTQFPLWMWAGAGVAFALCGIGFRRGRHRSGVLGALLLWALVWMILGEEPAALARGLLPAPPSGGLRVVTLNAAGGNPDAADEVQALAPDMVCLSEIPPKPERLKQLAARLYGGSAAIALGPDTAILARGVAEPLSLPPELGFHAVGMRLTRPDRRKIVVVSLRLDPPPLRLDIYRPEAWQAQSAHVRGQLAMLTALARFLKTLPPDQAIVVAGDFNMPSGDAATGPLRARLRDVFADAGRGWGATVENDMPLVRFDHIWIGGGLQARSAFAVRTQHSDHRALVAELDFAGT